MNITADKYFTANNILNFLNQAKQVFDVKGVECPNSTLDLGKVDRSDMLSVLIVYKFLEFSVTHRCYKYPKIVSSAKMIESWKYYGFYDLIINFINKKKSGEGDFRKLKVRIDNSFIIAPQALLRTSQFSQAVLNESFLPKIEGYYSSSEKASSMIFTCLSEIILNFWEHAVDDTQSIIVASGNKSKIEIACADTGKGIISSLREEEKYQELKGLQVLKESLSKGVTSKKNTNHMGYGLWILNQITMLTRGKLHLYSQGFFFQNNFGKISSGECGYWQGTIIYLNLPVTNPKTLSDIEEYKDNNFENLMINWD